MKRCPASTRIPLPAAAGVLALLLAVAAPGTAPAGQCVYSNGDTDDGPCMRFVNYAFADDFDLWCKQGPTASSTRIVVRHAESFTCRVANRSTEVAETSYNGNRETWSYTCGQTSTRIRRAKLDWDGDGQGIWSADCIGGESGEAGTQ